ncbi:MAG TPA: HNH endonuclease [Candidatus Binataceae bacterium]|nr:HNH endonuclease [Candidatus Binataceae bacterium]
METLRPKRPAVFETSRGDSFRQKPLASSLRQVNRPVNRHFLIRKANSTRREPRAQSANSYQLAATAQHRQSASVNRLTREAGFRRRILFAYGNRCAVTRVQLRLIDAAHILPLGAPGSADRVHNGIALSPTYHRAFDAGLIYLDEDFRMRLNDGQIQVLQRLNLVGGIESFKAPLGKIFLPPESTQWPSVDFIRRANRFRQIAA